MYLGFSHHVASRKFAFHEQVGKIHVELQHLHALLWFECDAQCLGFAVGVGREIDDF